MVENDRKSQIHNYNLFRLIITHFSLPKTLPQIGKNTYYKGIIIVQLITYTIVFNKLLIVSITDD